LYFFVTNRALWLRDFRKLTDLLTVLVHCCFLPTATMVTFAASERHRALTGTKLHRLVSEAHRCKWIVQARTHDRI